MPAIPLLFIHYHTMCIPIGSQSVRWKWERERGPGRGLW